MAAEDACVLPLAAEGVAGWGAAARVGGHFLGGAEGVGKGVVFGFWGCFLAGGDVDEEVVGGC